MRPLGQVFYLLSSRYLIDSSLTPHAHGGNPWLYWGIGAVIVLQLLFTYAPPFHAIFGNKSLPRWTWPWLIGGGIVFFLAVELEKLIIRSFPLCGRRRRIWSRTLQPKAPLFVTRRAKRTLLVG